MDNSLLLILISISGVLLAAVCFVGEWITMQHLPNGPIMSRWTLAEVGDISKD